METEAEKQAKRVTATLMLIVAGFVLICVGIGLRDWMTWATGAMVMRFAMWMGED